jgi:hypothetical protein
MAHDPTPAPTRSWILAEYTEVDALLSACRKARQAGYREVDTYSPYPLHGVDEALGWKPSRVPFIALAGMIAGGVGGFSMQYFLNAVDYPLNVGNRLLNSVPAWIPITFETTVLFTGVIMFLGLLALMGLPRPHHPVFESDAFQRSASTHAYWISVTVPTSDRDQEIADTLRSAGARTVEVVKEEA